MSDVQVMLYGYVGGEVTFKQLGRADVATFRVGTTPRTRDGQGGFKNGETVWTSITCWRTLAQNVKESVHVGDPVVVIGKARTERWVTPQGDKRERHFVEATTVGHDLAKGTSIFRKAPRSQPPRDDRDALGAVLDEAEQGPVGIDPVTGDPLYASAESRPVQSGRPASTEGPDDPSHRAA